MNSTTLAIQLVAAHRSTPGMAKAWQRLERFAYAMGETLEAEAELANTFNDAEALAYWAETRESMLGIAAAELHAMPALWAAILTAAVEQPK